MKNVLFLWYCYVTDDYAMPKAQQISEQDQYHIYL